MTINLATVLAEIKPKIVEMKKLKTAMARLNDNSSIARTVKEGIEDAINAALSLAGALKQSCQSGLAYLGDSWEGLNLERLQKILRIEVHNKNFEALKTKLTELESTAAKWEVLKANQYASMSMAFFSCLGALVVSFALVFSAPIWVPVAAGVACVSFGVASMAWFRCNPNHELSTAVGRAKSQGVIVHEAIKESNDLCGIFGDGAEEREFRTLKESLKAVHDESMKLWNLL
eukprot:TRINITY_DN79946_c0_g1_i1.p1 TRINITY_DN79946_c0_g1~~TRINITY_DN79946_c0_g1_i1.p1  ORF type:complete len:232 (-),score=51.77 TRINITY_DN79946_c0_g1_i1:60-755(-)